METLEDEHSLDDLEGTEAYRELEADLQDLSDSLVGDDACSR